MAVGAYDEATRFYEAALEQYRALGDDRGLVLVLGRLADDRLRRRDADGARELAEESLAIARRIGFRPGESSALRILADAELDAGDEQRALLLATEGVAPGDAADWAWTRVRSRHVLARALLGLDRVEDAEAQLRDALVVLETVRDRMGAILVLTGLVRVASRAGEPERAGRLWGALEAEHDRSPINTRFGSWADVEADHADVLRSVAGAAFESGRARGRLLSLEEACALERGGAPGASRVAERPGAPARAGLSSRAPRGSGSRPP